MDWTIEHLELIEEKFKWQFRRNEILRNHKIASNQEIVFHYFDKFNQKLIHEARSIVWNEDLINKLLHQIDLMKLSGNIHVSSKFINQNRERLNWDALSSNTKIDWDSQFIRQNKEIINWKNLSLNNGINWEEELIDEFQDFWDWRYLSQNSKINWTLDLIEKYQDKLDWRRLSYNPNAGFTIIYAETNRDRIDFHGLSRNKRIEWSDYFISKYEGDLNFGNYGLSWNISLPWNKALIEKYKNRWSWSGISSNRGVVWTEEIIDSFSKQLIWGRNDNIEEGSADFGHRRNGFCLSNNPKLPWSMELIDKYKDRLGSIATNPGIWNRVVKPILTNEERVRDIIKNNN